MRGYYLGAADDCEATPYTLDDGSTVQLDCQGRVIVPPSPSAWSFLTGSEVAGATGSVAHDVGQTAGAIAGQLTGGLAAGLGKGTAEGLAGGLMTGLGGLGGALVLLGGIAVVAYVLKR
jgi:hypothetical protein